MSNANAKVTEFKSARAAKMAYTKADNARKAKQNEGFTARDTYREEFRTKGSMDTAQYEALKATEERCEVEAAVLFETMRTIYTVATSQGFHLPTWHFGHNPTRDLIAANMD